MNFRPDILLLMFICVIIILVFTQTDLQRLTDINSFLSLSDRDFEWCCKFLLEKAGYGKVFVTKKGPKGGDGGIDLEIYSGDRKLITCGQCKLWKGRFKGLMKPLRELCGSMKIKGVSHGIFIITVEATPEEKQEAQIMDIEMIDATALLELVKRCLTNDVKNSTLIVAETSLTGSHERKEKMGTSHKIAKIVYAIIGFLLMVVGYAFVGAVIIFFALLALLSLGSTEAGSGNQRGYYRKRYRRSGKNYYRRRHKHSYSYGF